MPSDQQAHSSSAFPHLVLKLTCVSLQAMAPVRETAAQALGMCLSCVDTTTVQAVAHLLRQLQLQGEWHMRHGGWASQVQDATRSEASALKGWTSYLFSCRKCVTLLHENAQAAVPLQYWRICPVIKCNYVTGTSSTSALQEISLEVMCRVLSKQNTVELRRFAQDSCSTSDKLFEGSSMFTFLIPGPLGLDCGFLT